MNNSMESRPTPNPSHPGECLRDNLEASDLTQSYIAESISTGRSNLFRPLDGLIALTARTALALERLGWATAEH